MSRHVDALPIVVGSKVLPQLIQMFESSSYWEEIIVAVSCALDLGMDVDYSVSVGVVKLYGACLMQEEVNTSLANFILLGLQAIVRHCLIYDRNELLGRVRNQMEEFEMCNTLFELCKYDGGDMNTAKFVFDHIFQKDLTDVIGIPYEDYLEEH